MSIHEFQIPFFKNLEWQLCCKDPSAVTHCKGNLNLASTYSASFTRSCSRSRNKQKMGSQQQKTPSSSFSKQIRSSRVEFRNSPQQVKTVVINLNATQNIVLNVIIHAELTFYTCRQAALIPAPKSQGRDLWKTAKKTPKHAGIRQQTLRMAFFTYLLALFCGSSKEVPVRSLVFLGSLAWKSLGNAWMKYL